MGVARWIVGLLVLVAVLPGCATRRQGVDMSGFRESLRKELAFSPSAVPVSTTQAAVAPASTVVLARVSAQAYERVADGKRRSSEGRLTSSSLERRVPDSWRTADADAPWLVEEGATTNQSDVVVSSKKRARIIPASSLVLTPVRMSTDAILTTATQAGADWLCVFSAQTEYETLGGNNSMPLQIVTLGLFPTFSDAKSEVQMTIIDLRTRRIVDEWATQETGWQPTIGLTHENASAQTADRAETRAVRKVLDRLESRLDGGR